MAAAEHHVSNVSPFTILKIIVSLSSDITPKFTFCVGDRGGFDLIYCVFFGTFPSYVASLLGNNDILVNLSLQWHTAVFGVVRI